MPPLVILGVFWAVAIFLIMMSWLVLGKSVDGAPAPPLPQEGRGSIETRRGPIIHVAAAAAAAQPQPQPVYEQLALPSALPQGQDIDIVDIESGVSKSIDAAARPEQAGRVVMYKDINIGSKSKSKDGCSICLEEYEEEGVLCRVIMFNCKHYFHKQCVDEWLLKNTHCPICRASVPLPLEENDQHQYPTISTQDTVAMLDWLANFLEDYPTTGHRQWLF